jgi:hypothetical protein
MTFDFNEKELIYTFLGAIIKLLISFPNFIKLLVRSYTYVSDNINVWISVISGRFVFQCHFRFNIMSWNFWCMFKPLPIMLGKVLVEPIGWAGWCTQHNGQVWDHSMTFRSGGRFNNLFPKVVFNRGFVHCYDECMTIAGELCHMFWSRKWHYLPPQTLM